MIFHCQECRSATPWCSGSPVCAPLCCCVSASSRRSVCIIKGGAFASREAIIESLRQQEFVVIERRDTTLTRAQSVRLYVHHYGLPFYSKLIDSMCAGPVCVLILQRHSAIAELRHLVGPTDPPMARQVDPNCLRAIYGRTIIDNGLHASKNASEAEREEDALFQRRKRTVIMFGPPASGKGTQCDLLVSAYGMVHISTGDLLRKHVKDQTEIGVEIKSFLDSGKLVPDALVTRLTLERLAEADCEERGFLLDGFPRTSNQAQSLIDAGLAVNRFIVLAADYDSIVQRVAGRRFDPKTGATYHVVHNPPPAGLVADRCVIRNDDRPEVVRARLATYDTSVAAVVKQFADVRVVQCDSQGIHDVFVQIVRCVDQEGTQKNVAKRSKSANTKKRLTAKL